MKRRILVVILLIIATVLLLSSCDLDFVTDLLLQEHVHEYGKWHVMTEASCTEDGLMYRECMCGEKEYKSITATGHTESEWITKSAPTCTEAGEKYKECTVCHELLEMGIISASGHSYKPAVTEPTCAKQGYTTHTCHCGDSYVDSYTEALGHKESDWIIDKAPTCTEAGLKHKECTVCHEELETEAIKANGHDYGEWTETLAPTCTKEGEERRDCVNCDHYETREVEANGHTYGTWINEVPATCTEDGTLGHYHCSVCEKNFDEDKKEFSNLKIKAIGHLESDLIIDVFPTIYSEGRMHTYCTVCFENVKTDIVISRIVSSGLEYEVNLDGTTCTITGIGNCNDEIISIPDYICGYKVVAIGKLAFANCSSVTTIALSNNIKTIGYRAFYKTSISEIHIPESVTKIENQIFMGCESLTTVYYDSSYAPPEGETFIKCSSIKKIVFGENLTIVPSYICYNCDNLEEIILSPNTKSIGSYAFYYCTSVEKIRLPEGLVNTGWYAFYAMNITEIIIPDSVTDVYNSFRDCEKLEKLVIPVSVISIPNQTFYGCSSIKEIYYMGDELEWSSISISKDSSVLKSATVYYYSETQPIEEGNYWHYIDDMPRPW